MPEREELWVLHRDTETGKVRRMERIPEPHHPVPYDPADHETEEC